MLLVDIYIAALGKTFDFELDPDEPIMLLIRDIVRLLQEESGEEREKMCDHMQPQLYSCDQERMLPALETLAGCGIRNGFRLILC